MDATIIPLQQMYLSVLTLMLKDEKLDTLSVERPGCPTHGVLYAVREGTTAAELVIEYGFENGKMLVLASSRDGRKLTNVITFVDGIDEYLKRLRTFLRANRLAAPVGRGLGAVGSRKAPAA